MKRWGNWVILFCGLGTLYLCIMHLMLPDVEMRWYDWLTLLVAVYLTVTSSVRLAKAS